MLSTLTTAVPAGLAAHPWVGHPGPGPGFGWWVIFPFLWFLLVATVVVLIVRGVRHGARGSYGPPWARGNGSAIAILGERYARGEIDETEYRARLEVLSRQV